MALQAHVIERIRPGEVAQVDFGSVGKIYDAATGVRRKARVFVMTLGFSRRHFACLCFDQKVETWLLGHILAFEHFGDSPIPRRRDVTRRSRFICEPHSPQ